MAHDVFISYSAEDKAVADAVCATLEGRKIRCWIAPRDVLPGVPYAEALIDGLSRSRILVLVFSASSNSSPQVMREIERAVNKGVPVIPFRIENIMPSKSMEYFLSAPHWLDALTPPLEKHLQKLADTVQALLTAEAEKLQKAEPATPVPQPTPEVKPARKLRPVYILTGIVVIALLIVGVFYLTGGFGKHDEGKTTGSLPNPTSTATSSPATTPKQQPTTAISPTPQPTTTSTTKQTSAPTTTPTSTLTPTSTPAPTVTSTSTATTTTAGTPGVLASGSSVKGELKFTGEVHWYTFDAQAGDSVYIVLVEGTKDSPFYPWLGLLDPDGGVVYENYYSDSVQIDRKLTKAGKYTVRVRDHNLGTGPYVLSFSQLSKTSNAISLGSTQSQLTFTGEVHWYTFDAQAGDSVYIVLTEGTKDSPFYPWLGLLDPDGGVVYENYYSDSVQIDYKLAKTGKYTIRVRDHNLGTGPYVLSFSQLSKTSNPITPGASIQGQLKFPGEVHWYTFDGKTGDSVYIVLTEGIKGSTFYPWLGLLDPDGGVVYENYYSDSVQIDRKLTKTGKYTIRVRDHAIGTGSYVLSFNMLVNP